MKANTTTAVIAILFLLFSGIHTVLGQDGPLGQFDDHGDVGSPAIPGSASYDAASDTYTLTGSGSNIWGPKDQFQFLWKKMSGDFIVRARVEFTGKGAEYRKIGWMARANLESNSPYADAVAHGGGLTSLQFRPYPGSNSVQYVLPITNADIIQFERRGTNYIFSAAKNGDTFVSTNLSDISLPDNVYVGLFVCAHNAAAKETAIFHDVQIIRPAKPNFVPYRDFIGCVLHVLDVQNGELQTVHASAQPFEAPDWTHDGRSLIYNISGRAQGWGKLVRFDLATRQETVIDTGPEDKNNNDHVLSFDGTMLAISDQSQSHGGKSAVFTVPVGGGMPKPITTASPSYAHTWSPDGKFIIFTGNRTNKWDIYKISCDGGPEIKLTDTIGVNDGPEFTPNGKWIYFNSSRTGRMQIWRMRPNGKGKEQVTHDDFNDWFPHISPDGKWIAFISFPADVDPGSHPYYKECYIRLMPVKGGEPKVVAYLYGGQGSMNVPSWSPDSTKIAFVSNTDMSGQ